jgi:putative ABC transport system permease protein
MLAGRLMAGQLFGVGAVSVVTTIAVGGVVMAMAWIAAYVPARRASRVDPAIVLRAD